MRYFLFLFLVCGTAMATPYPPPLPEPVIVCNKTLSMCGDHGTCQLKNAEYICVCEPQFGTLNATDPCAHERTSKSLVFFLQIFFGFLGVSPFILHWYWYAASLYIVYALACICKCCEYHYKDQHNERDGLCFVCGSCSATCTVLGLWIATLVYIVSDCYSVENNVSFKCWENL